MLMARSHREGSHASIGGLHSGATNGCANRTTAESRPARLSRCRTNFSCMDSHRPGLDGLWVCCGAIRALLGRASGRPTYSPGTVLRAVVMVRHGAHLGRSHCQCCCRMAARPVGPRVGSQRNGTLSAFNPDCRDCFLPGIGGAGNGDLSGFYPQFHSFAV